MTNVTEKPLSCYQLVTLFCSVAIFYQLFINCQSLAMPYGKGIDLECGYKTAKIIVKLFFSLNRLVIIQK